MIVLIRILLTKHLHEGLNRNYQFSIPCLQIHQKESRLWRSLLIQKWFIRVWIAITRHTNLKPFVTKGCGDLFFLWEEGCIYWIRKISRSVSFNIYDGWHYFSIYCIIEYYLLIIQPLQSTTFMIIPRICFTYFMEIDQFTVREIKIAHFNFLTCLGHTQIKRKFTREYLCFIWGKRSYVMKAKEISFLNLMLTIKEVCFTGH